MKFILCFIFSISMLFAETHTVIFKGIEVGTIQNFNNQILSQNYIVSKLNTDYFADYFKPVFKTENVALYKGAEPSLTNTFFKKSDKLISSLKSIKENHNGYHVLDDNTFDYNCINDICSYKYFSKETLKSYGKVIFVNNNISYIEDNLNNLIITLN